jgi:ATP-binding cassette subfamily B multidrug efflux pump
VLLSWPLIAFGWVINLVQRGVASWERMLEVLDTPVAASSGAGGVDRPARIEGRIEARHLSFRYPGTEVDALHDVSFVVEAGQTLALVGATGSGKSTLVQVLTRLQEPERGRLYLDGSDIRDLPLPVLRGAMAVVPQEAFLFSDTLGGNILFGVEADWAAPGTRERVAAVADTVALTDDVAEFAGGLDTIIGELGITLSGGQKQRAALARAVLTDRPILVLDDTLSAVDTATESAILEHLREVRRNRTCIIVAHRVSTVRDADLILVLANGQVVERGTHDSLVAAEGVYADLHRRQLLEAELAGV